MSAETLANMGIIYTERREFDLNMDSDVKELRPDATPLLTDLIDRKVKTDDADFKMFEDDSLWYRQEMTINKATPGAWTDDGDPGATRDALVVDGLVGLKLDASLEGLLVEVWNAAKTTKKGIARVRDINSGNGQVTLTAITNPAAVNQRIAALADNDVLMVISHAAGEGSHSPEAYGTQPRIVWNSTEITRTPIEVTGTLKEAALKGLKYNGKKSADELMRLRRDKMLLHKMRLQRKVLLGARVGGIGAAGENFLGHTLDKEGKVVRTTEGFIPAMERYGVTTGTEQNIFTIDPDNYTFSDFGTDTDKLSQYTMEDGIRVAYCGPGAMNYLSSLVMLQKSQWQINITAGEEDKYGSRVRYLETGNLTLKLVKLEILRGTPYENWILLPDLECIEYRYFRPDRFNTNIKTENAYDGVKDEYFSDAGIALQHMKRHAIMKIG